MIFTENEKQELLTMLHKRQLEGDESMAFAIKLLEGHILPWLDTVEPGDFSMEDRRVQHKLREIALDFELETVLSVAPELTKEEVLQQLQPEQLTGALNLVGAAMFLCAQFLRTIGVREEVIQGELQNFDSELEKLLDE